MKLIHSFKIQDSKFKIRRVALFSVRNTIIGLLSLLSIANVAHAATFSQVVGKIVGLLNTFLGALIGLAVLFTVYAVFKYFVAGAESVKKSEAVKMLTWGVVGIFVMTSVWAVVFVVANTFFDSGSMSAPSSSEDIIDPRLRRD